MDKSNLLDKYFEDALTEEERSQFELLLRTDAEFLEAFNFQKELKSALIRNERKVVKEKLKAHDRSKKTLSFDWKYVAAAMVALCIGLYFFTNQTVQSQALYAEYYEVFPNVVSPVVRADMAETNLEQKAFIAYESGDYNQAIALFTTIYDTTHMEYAVFYKAMSMMQTDAHWPETIQILATTNWSELFRDKAKWYLSLAYLHQNQPEQAQATLKELSAESTYRSQQVKALLEKL